MRIAITGSSGFIGSALAAHFLQQGHSVILMQRNAPASLSANAEYLHFDLRKPQLPDPTGLTAIVHCAVMAHSTEDREAEDVNIHATLALREHCKKFGIRFIFLGSMSAHEGAESVYGRHKFRLEQLLNAPNETVLKLGLVLGAQGGLFQRISSSIADSPIVPLVGNGMQPIQTVLVDEVCTVVTKCLNENLTGHFLLGSEKVYTLRELYQEIARLQGRKFLFVPLPYSLFALVLRLAALLRLSLPVSMENLLGLKHLRAFDTAPDLRRLGISLKPLGQAVKSIQKSPFHEL